jgi:hypothetical protein
MKYLNVENKMFLIISWTDSCDVLLTSILGFIKFLETFRGLGEFDDGIGVFNLEDFRLVLKVPGGECADGIMNCCGGASIEETTALGVDALDVRRLTSFWGSAEVDFRGIRLLRRDGGGGKGKSSVSPSVEESSGRSSSKTSQELLISFPRVIIEQFSRKLERVEFLHLNWKSGWDEKWR